MNATRGSDSGELSAAGKNASSATLFIYTSENQQVLWNEEYWMLDKGVPTGGKHCVPLATIFLTFIMRDLLRNNDSFRNDFETRIKLWTRFIDDCGGVYL